MHVLYGHLATFRDEPGIVGADRAVLDFEDGALVIDDDGYLAWVGDRSDLPDDYRNAPSEDHTGALILPGFIDAHLHYPQYRLIGAPARNLLEWLERHTFPEEMRFADKGVASYAAARFLEELANHGITAAMVFSTVHPQALDALFEEATPRNLALLSGKTMMDRNAPPGLTDTPQQAYDDTLRLVERWHGKGRLQYALSPRFAVTSSEAQLEMVGALRKLHPRLALQSHLSENTAEIEAVAAAFPWSKDYTDVYDHYGLLGDRCLYAHGIHLGERERARLSETGASVVHCPTSNSFLGSGLFGYHKTRHGNHPVTVGIGCDIGGGTGFSMLETMREAFTVSQLVGAPINAFDAFYMATLGNARLLHLDDETGSLDTGKMADLVVLDPAATPIMADRHMLSNDLEDVLFSLMILGDDRSVRQCWTGGRKVKDLGNPT